MLCWNVIIMVQIVINKIKPITCCSFICMQDLLNFFIYIVKIKFIGQYCWYIDSLISNISATMQTNMSLYSKIIRLKVWKLTIRAWSFEYRVEKSSAAIVTTKMLSTNPNYLCCCLFKLFPSLFFISCLRCSVSR